MTTQKVGKWSRKGGKMAKTKGGKVFGGNMTCIHANTPVSLLRITQSMLFPGIYRVTTCLCFLWLLLSGHLNFPRNHQYVSMTVIS